LEFHLAIQGKRLEVSRRDVAPWLRGSPIFGGRRQRGRMRPRAIQACNRASQRAAVPTHRKGVFDDAQISRPTGSNMWEGQLPIGGRDPGTSDSRIKVSGGDPDGHSLRHTRIQHRRVPSASGLYSLRSHYFVLSASPCVHSKLTLSVPILGSLALPL